jgi:hypothetical protein
VEKWSNFISFSEKFPFKFISDTGLPGSGIIFPDPYPDLLKVSDPTGFGPTTLEQGRSNRNCKVDWSLKEAYGKTYYVALFIFNCFIVRKTTTPKMMNK